MSAATLLAWARALMERPEFGLEGAWPRAASLLGRQALESGLDQLWDREFELMKRTARATQLASIEQFVDPDLAEGVRVAWYALSRACHHHPYELSPTAAELEGWFDRVERLVRLLEAGSSQLPV